MCSPTYSPTTCRHAVIISWFRAWYSDKISYQIAVRFRMSLTRIASFYFNVWTSNNISARFLKERRKNQAELTISVFLTASTLPLGTTRSATSSSMEVITRRKKSSARVLSLKPLCTFVRSSAMSSSKKSPQTDGYSWRKTVVKAWASLFFKTVRILNQTRTVRLGCR